MFTEPEQLSAYEKVTSPVPIRLDAPYIRELVVDVLTQRINGEAEGMSLIGHEPQTPTIEILIAGDIDVLQAFIDYVRRIESSVVALEAVANEGVSIFDWPFGIANLIESVTDSIQGIREWLPEAPANQLQSLTNAIRAGETFLAALSEDGKR